jgi:hypothetical protein
MGDKQIPCIQSRIVPLTDSSKEIILPAFQYTSTMRCGPLLIAGVLVSDDHFKRYRQLSLLYLIGFLVITGIDAVS